MVTFVAVLMVAIALGAWDRYTRRHPAWDISAGARFWISSGYPMAAVAAYFLAGFGGADGPAWVAGLVWALAAAVMFGTGYSALNHVLRRQHSVALSIETIEHTPDFRAPTTLA